MDWFFTGKPTLFVLGKEVAVLDMGDDRSTKNVAASTIASSPYDMTINSYSDEVMDTSSIDSRVTRDRPIVTIRGDHVDDLNGFYDEVSRQLIPGADWGRNLDAFNDILRGGFGTPDDGFILHWTNSARSQRQLGHSETARWLSDNLTRCHPSNVPSVQIQLDLARHGKGPTLFDTLVDIIRSHGAGGDEADDNVELLLR